MRPSSFALFLSWSDLYGPRMSNLPRMAALPPGPFARLATLLGNHKPGKEPISLAVGDPSGAVPDFVKDALAKSAPASAIIPPSSAPRIGVRPPPAGSTAVSR